MTLIRDFGCEYSDDYRYFSTGTDVVGISYRMENAIKFSRSTNQSIEFELEPNNPHDPNAIKVMGKCIHEGKEIRLHLGYVDRYKAKQIYDRNLQNRVVAVLKRIWHGGYHKDVIYIKMKILISPTEIVIQQNKKLINWNKVFEFVKDKIFSITCTIYQISFIITYYLAIILKKLSKIYFTHVKKTFTDVIYCNTNNVSDIKIISSLSIFLVVTFVLIILFFKVIR